MDIGSGIGTTMIGFINMTAVKEMLLGLEMDDAIQT